MLFYAIRFMAIIPEGVHIKEGTLSCLPLIFKIWPHMDGGMRCKLNATLFVHLPANLSIMTNNTEMCLHFQDHSDTTALTYCWLISHLLLQLHWNNPSSLESRSASLNSNQSAYKRSLQRHDLALLKRAKYYQCIKNMHDEHWAVEL